MSSVAFLIFANSDFWKNEKETANLKDIFRQPYSFV
jgi:hypothetical protein